MNNVSKTVCNIFLVCWLSFCLAFILACGQPSLSKELMVFNWQDYIPNDVLDDFRKETGINLIYDTYGSNEDMYQKLINGAQYDVVFPSTDFVVRMNKKGLLEKISRSRIPELENIDPNMGSKNDWDPGYEHSVPYNFGATAITYWKDKVRPKSLSWDFLTSLELKNHLMLLDDPREVLGAALKFNGFSANSDKLDELEKAQKTVLEWKKNIIKFDNDLIKSAFARKEIYAGLAYPESQLAELDEADKENFTFFFPKEGGIMYLDVMVVMKNARNSENAYTFINFILRPEILARICDDYGYPGLYPKTQAFRKKKSWYTLADLKNHDLRSYLDDESLLLYEKIWEEIKVQSK